MFSKLKEIFRNRFARKAFLFYFGSQILIIGLVLTFIYFFMSRSLEKSLREVVLAKEHELTVTYEQEGLKKVTAPQTGFYLRILNDANQVIYHAGLDEEGDYPVEKSVDAKAAIRVPEWFVVTKEDDEDRLILISEKLAPDMRIQIGKSTSDLNGYIEELAGIYLSIIGPFFLLSLSIALFLAYKTTKQFNDVIATLQKIKSGSLKERATVDSGDVSDIVTLFNQMMDQIEILVVKNKEELDHFAHDIKTPITRFKLAAEHALIKRDDVASAFHALDEANSASDEIIQIISSLFDISLAESGANKLSKSVFNFSSVVQEVIELYEFVASDKNITFQFSPSPGIDIFADRLQIKRIVSNLIDNAVKYSNTNGVISLEVGRECDQLYFSVEDQGIGIPSEDITLIWGRFFRGKTATQSTSGFGLGLSFVKAMVERHGGVVFAKSSPGGSLFKVSFPEKTI